MVNQMEMDMRINLKHEIELLIGRALTATEHKACRVQWRCGMMNPYDVIRAVGLD